MSNGIRMRPRRSHRGPGPQVLLALFAAGMVLFNFPLLIVFDRDATAVSYTHLTLPTN